MDVLLEKEDCKIQLLEYSSTGNVKLRIFWNHKGEFVNDTISVATDGEGLIERMKESEEFFEEEVLE